jgi:hypothetical protein
MLCILLSCAPDMGAGVGIIIVLLFKEIGVSF